MTQSLPIFYMICSAIFFSVMYGLIKYLDNFSVYQIIFFRATGTLVFTIPLVLKTKLPFFGKNKKILFLRGFVGLISMIFFFQSISYLNL